MKLRRAGLRAFRLRLEEPLATAHGVIHERAGFLVLLEDADGCHGLGEATPLPEFGTETLESSQRLLRKVCAALVTEGEGTSAGPGEPRDPTSSLSELAAPCARAALECALDDLEARRAGVSVSRLWRKRAQSAGLVRPLDPMSGRKPSGGSDEHVWVQALLGGDTPDAVDAAARRARSEGFRAFKLKVAAGGDPGRELDVQRVTALREAAGPEAVLRLDANEGWSRTGALSALQALAKFDIDFVEQPVARADLEGLAWLSAEAPIDVAADESLLGDGLDRVIESRAAHVWVAKPAALGGFRAALRLSQAAEEQGARLIWSSLLDGAISCMAATQWAAAVSRREEFQGLGTGPLLAVDFEGGARLASGRLSFANLPGLGFDAEVFVRDAGPIFSDQPVWFETAR